MTTFSRSSTDLMKPTPRMKNSMPFFSSTLAPTSMFDLRTASYTSMQRDAVGAQFVGVNVDLVLLHEAADAGDFADAFDGVELVAQIPVLDGTQFREVEAFRLDRVPVDLPQRRGVRARAPA